MKNKYDIIGDIHGHHNKLLALLGKLGYLPHDNHYHHPEGRKVIFLGDYVDRGPKTREVLHLVRNMMDAGEALAIAGNHELNAVLYATEKPGGGHLRAHNEKNVKQHAATLAAFAGREDEWKDWIVWFKRLPLFLDLGELRAVHAAWADEHIEFLRGKTLTDEAFLNAVGTKGTREYKAVEFVLKGPELRLPDGVTFRDKENIERKDVRVRWWDIEKAKTLGDLVMPEPMSELVVPVGDEHRARLANYPKDAPPVFAGHYWLPPNSVKLPRTKNIAILDFGAGLSDNPLVAYRWNGEARLNYFRFVASSDGSGEYEIYVNERVYIDDYERRVIGKFDTYHAAVEAAKAIVEAYLPDFEESGFTTAAMSLFDYPNISPTPTDGYIFDAHWHATSRAWEICEDRTTPPEPRSYHEERMAAWEKEKADWKTEHGNEPMPLPPINH